MKQKIAYWQTHLLNVHINMDMCVCMYVYIYIYIYIHAYIINGEINFGYSIYVWMIKDSLVKILVHAAHGR